MKKLIILSTGILIMSCTATPLEEEVNALEEITQTETQETTVSDKEDGITNKDSDNDGIPDAADADVDGDGILDNGTDDDGDGINDAADVDTDDDGVNDNGTDIDDDGINDEYDDDIDGDGIQNEEDEYQNLSDTSLSAATQQKITDYIAANHPNETITEVEIENERIEIHLSETIELQFNLDGDFLAVENQSNQEDDHDDANETDSDDDNDNDGDNDDDDDGDYDDNNDDGDNDDDDNNGDYDDNNDDDSEQNEQEYTSLENSSLSTAVQEKIKVYLSANYAGQSVVKVEVEQQKIEVKLNNGKELIFDLNGTFVRIDD